VDASADWKNFTTRGKPTKAIETPWGLRVVYDPAKDDVVRLAFKRIYDRNEGVILLEPPNHTALLKQKGNGQYFISKGPENLDEASLYILRTLYENRVIHHEINCKKFKESSCGSVVRIRENCDPKIQVDCFVVHSSSAIGRCRVNNKTTFNRQYHPIGKNFHSYAQSNLYYESSNIEMNFDKQFESFFRVECIEWS